MIRRIAIAAAIAFQVLALAALAGKHYYVLARGSRIRLRTEPIDPRSLFRGDYVELRYAISTLPPEIVPPELRDLRRGDRIYVTLVPSGEPDATWKASAVSRERPSEGAVCIRGRLEYRFSRRGPLRVRYGIEAFFVEQGRGRRIERATRRGARERAVVEAAILPSGEAAIAAVIAGGERYEG